MDTPGYVLLQNNRIDEEMKMLERAALLFPANLTVRYHLPGER